MLLFLLREFNERGYFYKYTVTLPITYLSHEIKLGTIISLPWFQYTFYESYISSDCELLVQIKEMIFILPVMVTGGTMTKEFLYSILAGLECPLLKKKKQ